MDFMDIEICKTSFEWDDNCVKGKALSAVSVACSPGHFLVFMGILNGIACVAVTNH